MELITILVALWFAGSMLAILFNIGPAEFGPGSTAISGIALIACLAYWGSVGGN